MDTFIGRDNPVQAIRNVITDTQPKSTIRILAISGPGGIGKSFLLEHALSELDLPHLGYLPLRVNGNTSSVTLAEIIVRDLIATAPPAVAGDPLYFRVTRQGWDYLQSMDANARAELEDMASDKNDDALAKIIGAAYDGVVGLLEIVPDNKARKVTRFTQRIQGRDIERFISVARRAQAYREEQGPLFGLLPVGWAAKERNLLRKDLQGRLAEYLKIDLAAIISGYRPEDWKRYLPPKVQGLDRCLMIFDDYETLESTVDDFLKQELLPRLREMKFQSVIIILGRDSIRDVHYGWDQYFGKEIVPDIRLAPFSEPESRDYLETLGINNNRVQERIMRDSLGLPFLLAAEAECELRGGASALSLQKFVDRTTRWMSPEQKAWTLALAFLEDINADSVKCMLPDSDPDAVVEWFKHESSIRSPEAAKWRMLPLIRSRLQASVQNDAPSQYKTYQERATRANRLVT